MLYTVNNQGVVCVPSKSVRVIAEKRVKAADLGITRRVVRCKEKPATLKLVG